MHTDRRSRAYGLALTVLVQMVLVLFLLIRLPMGSGGKAGKGLTVFTLAPPAEPAEAGHAGSAKPRNGLPDHGPAADKGKAQPTNRLAAPEGLPARDSGEAVADQPPGAPRAATREARIDFQAILLKHIEQYRHFPEDARQARQQGTVLVGFVLVRGGTILDAWVDRSSGFASLDREAVATVKRAQPLPRIPDALPDSLEVVLPVSFDLD